MSHSKLALMSATGITALEIHALHIRSCNLKIKDSLDLLAIETSCVLKSSLTLML